MSRSKSSNGYPFAFFQITEQFHSGFRGTVQIDGREIIMPGEDPRKRIERTRFEYYDYKKALKREGSYLTKAAEAMILTVEGTILTFANRDNTRYALALEKAIFKQLPSFSMQLPPEPAQPQALAAQRHLEDVVTKLGFASSQALKTNEERLRDRAEPEPTYEEIMGLEPRGDKADED